MTEHKIPLISLPPYKINDLSFSTMSGQVKDYWHDLIGTTDAFKQTKGVGVVAFVLDTAYKVTHPDLYDNVLHEYCVTFTDDKVDNNNQKHGDHVAGLIAGTDNNIGIIGVAPATKLVLVRCLNGNGQGYENWIADAIKYCADVDLGEHNNDKRIINMSLGMSGTSRLIENALKYVNSKGVFVVCAAGNSGYDGKRDSVNAPAIYDDLVISVSSINEKDQFSDFSSGGVAVDIAAYGENIYSTYGDYGYASLDGTSMATPIVTGACALILSKWGDVINTHRDLEIHLKNNAKDLGISGEDNYFGAGALKLEGAIKNNPNPIEPPIIEQPKLFKFAFSDLRTIKWKDNGTNNYIKVKEIVLSINATEKAESVYDNMKEKYLEFFDGSVAELNNVDFHEILHLTVDNLTKHFSDRNLQVDFISMKCYDNKKRIILF